MSLPFVADTPTDDRWLRAWAVGYAAVGGASVLLPLYALSLDGGVVAAAAVVPARDAA